MGNRALTNCSFDSIGCPVIFSTPYAEAFSTATSHAHSSEKLGRTRSDLWDCLAGLAVELEAAELLPEIRRAYEDGLLSPEMNIEEIEEYLYEADWEDFGSLISQAFSGEHRLALDQMTGKGWWTRSDREP